jgi:hypothetical protein
MKSKYLILWINSIRFPYSSERSDDAASTSCCEEDADVRSPGNPIQPCPAGNQPEGAG